MRESKKKGLGRGLSALFGDAKEVELHSENNSQNTALIGEICSNQFQPRIKFDEKKLEELSNSIKNNGLIQPIAVRHSKGKPEKYEIIAGERRWLAAQKAGLHEVPIIIHYLSDNETLEVAILENIQREDLNSIEEARGYERLKSDFNYDHDKIGKTMSKSRSHVSNTLRLLTLPSDVIMMIEEGNLTAGQARPLIGLSDPSSVAESILKKKMSARSVEHFVKNEKNKIYKRVLVDPNINNAQKKIEDHLGLKVNISNKKNNSGKISIEYKDIGQFEMISNLLTKE
jgi:ParB family chromosome partitioning protein